MSEPDPKGGGETNHVKWILLGLAAAAQVVPGYQLLAGEDWQPPEMQAAFALGASVVGTAAVGVLYIARHRVLRLRTRTVLIMFAAGVVLSLTLALVYRSVLETRYVSYLYGKQSYAELVPFGTSRWVDSVFLRRIRTANFAVDTIASADDVRPSHLRRTLQRYGPGTVRREVPATWRHFTTTALWLNYVTIIGLIVAAFGMIAMRLPSGLSNPKPPGTGASTEEGTGVVPDTPAPRLEAHWERTLAELQAELREIRSQLSEERASRPAGDDHSVGSVFLRVEARVPSWLLVGAAAAAGWALGRERPRR